MHRASMISGARNQRRTVPGFNAHPPIGRRACPLGHGATCCYFAYVAEQTARALQVAGLLFPPVVPRHARPAATRSPVG